MAELPPSLGLSQQRHELPAENSPVTLALLSTKNGTIFMLAISWELLPRHFLPVGFFFWKLIFLMTCSLQLAPQSTFFCR